jgi:hypothetical protein
MVRLLDWHISMVGQGRPKKRKSGRHVSLHGRNDAEDQDPSNG